jgi:GT2 family glycosyltransferase
VTGQPRLSIIIVNWNTKPYLESCLASIHDALPSVDTEVIVVDNASADGSPKMVREGFPGDHLVANATNRGFAGGVNDGLRLATGRFILILNPDIVIRKGVVEQLMAFMEQEQGVGAVMPSLRNEDGSLQKGYVRRLPSLMQVLLFATVLQPWASRKPRLVGRYLEAPRGREDVVDVEQIPGGFLLSAREVLELVGPFDESYRLFFEDVDWCSRVRERGLRLIMLSFLEITHIGGRSFVVDKGNWVQARYFVSLVRYFVRRKSAAAAFVVGAIVCLNAVMVYVKNSVVRGGSDAEARRRAALSRRTYENVLRLLFRAFILRRDEVVLP